MSDTCTWCHEPVLPGDKLAPISKPAHYECGVRMVAGGLRHQMGQCTCCGGTLPPDDPKLSARAAAKVACDFFLLNQLNQKRAT